MLCLTRPKCYPHPNVARPLRLGPRGFDDEDSAPSAKSELSHPGAPRAPAARRLLPVWQRLTQIQTTFGTTKRLDTSASLAHCVRREDTPQWKGRGHMAHDTAMHRADVPTTLTWCTRPPPSVQTTRLVRNMRGPARVRHISASASASAGEATAVLAPAAAGGSLELKSSNKVGLKGGAG